MATKLYPVTAPGLPLPGPCFLQYVADLGSKAGVKVTGKGKKKKVEFQADPRLEEQLSQALYSVNTYLTPLTVKGKTVFMPILTGHKWGAKYAEGPTPCDIMIIGKIVSEDDSRFARQMSGSTGKALIDMAKEAGIDPKRLRNAYVTTVIKCEHPDDNQSWSESWSKEFLHLLHQEIKIVRPKYILCLGAEAVKALFGKQYTITKMEGRVIEYQYCIDPDYRTEPTTCTAEVMACPHPGIVVRDPAQKPVITNVLRKFNELINGVRWDAEEEGLDHRLIDNIEDLRKLTKEIIADKSSYFKFRDGKTRAVISLDAEWNGDHPQNSNSYVRTIQISWSHKKAACIILHEQGGTPCFEGGLKSAIKELRKILKSTPQREVRLVGHFLVSDLEFLLPLGLDVLQDYMVPEDPLLCEHQGGFDTGLAYHSIEETGDFSLKSMALRFTTAPRYDVQLQEWIKKHCKKLKELADEGEGFATKEKELEGYGDCPGDILYPYGNYDADVTRRLFFVMWQKLCCDDYGVYCWEPFWINMRCVPAILEMHTNGLYVDRSRIDALTVAYMKTRKRLLQEIRDFANWPEFKLSSPYDVREFLFGEEYNKKKRPTPDSPPVRIRPEGALSLGLTPILTTDKRPMPWSEVVAQGLENEKTAGTNKTNLAILAQESLEVPVLDPVTGKTELKNFSEPVQMVRNYRFIEQVLKSILRPPVEGTELVRVSKTGKQLRKAKKVNTGELIEKDGYWVYAGGLPASICDDNRVRTHIYPTKETGRWSSARPPLQNIPKRREDDHKKILATDYEYPLRSLITATPGRVLIEADFIGAELYGMAMMAGDETMLDHCLRNQLKEDDPNYYDIHSNIAVFAFRLDCEPTKKALQDIGRAGLRIVAKSVIFGIAYGRGAKAIAIAAKEENVNVTVDEAQQVIDAVFAMYPKLLPFYEKARRRVIRERHIINAFGRVRRFPPIPGVDQLIKFWEKQEAGLLSKEAREPKLPSHVRQLMGEYQRQGMNFPIQSMIADAMSRAIDNLYNYRFQFSREELWYDLVLQIHDAVLLEADSQFVPRIVDEVFPKCMQHAVKIYPCTLDGVWDNTGPYTLGVDVEVYTAWGVVPLPDELEKLGIPLDYGHWHPVENKLLADGVTTANGFTHDKYSKKIWLPGKGLTPLFVPPKK